jgi:hypothetical protein
MPTTTESSQRAWDDLRREVGPGRSAARRPSPQGNRVLPSCQPGPGAASSRGLRWGCAVPPSPGLCWTQPARSSSPPLPCLLLVAGAEAGKRAGHKNSGLWQAVLQLRVWLLQGRERHGHGPGKPGALQPRGSLPPLMVTKLPVCARQPPSIFLLILPPACRPCSCSNPSAAR